MKNLNLTRLQNSEHLALMSDTLELLNEANLPALEALKTAFSEQVSLEEAAQKQIRKNERTKELAVLDEKRGSIYRGLVLRVQSEEYSANEERKKSAEKIYLVIKTYGNFTTYNYQKETTDVQNFIAELKSSEFFPAAKKIGLEEWINWLETANIAFKTLYNERRDEYATQTTYDLKNIRKEIDAIFKKIQQTAEAILILQPSDEINLFTSKLNTSINKWREVLSMRIGRNSDSNFSKEQET
ncbi:MAG: DUF6261 family protein [Capnocytophaga sp.]|nr:DUF6261 family protein [Capnocytophaga sp.]